jgi:LmbE family N-acetylglucosaminyl deacetylase
MLKPIKSYFAPLTREQIEQNELTSKQAARIRREREEEKAEAARVVASQVNNVIEIIDDDSQEIGDNVRDSIEVIIHSLGPDVVTSTNVSRMPRPKKIIRMLFSC